ncbi:MAG: hypothetical protein Q4E39_00790 [bacterium]|nr:hypothetical protein [bacterium]
MSILQEYEEIKKSIGTEKYEAIEIYLDKVNKEDNVNKMYSEYGTLSYESDDWISQMEEIKKKYNVILLSDILYKENEWKKFDNWYKNEFPHRKVEITDVWKSDFGDMRCRAMLYQNNKMVGNIVASYELDYKDIFIIKNKMKSLIYRDFEKYINLPKISKCSKLMKEIYDTVHESESTMCHITEEDWKEYYADDFNDYDIEKLKEEVKKYNLDDIITFEEDEYKILGYGNLELSFNDDRSFCKDKERGR